MLTRFLKLMSKYAISAPLDVPHERIRAGAGNAYNALLMAEELSKK